MKLLALLPLRFPKLDLPGGSRRDRARGSVLLGFLAVIAAHLWLAVQVETTKPHWRDPEFFHRQQRAAALVEWERGRGHTKPLVVILGGSRPQMGLSPEAMNRVFGDSPTDPLAYNAAQSGSLPVGLALNFHRFISSGTTPGYVLIEVLPPVLADPGPMEHRVSVVRLSHSELMFLEPYVEDPQRQRREWLHNRMFSWQSLRYPLLANWGLAEAFPPGPASTHHLWKHMTFLGWGGFAPREWTNSQREEQLTVARRTYGWLLDDFRIQPVNDRILRDLLTECRNRGVKPALFTMPESPRFRSWYPPGVHEGVSGYLAALAAEHGIPFFDTSAWIDDEAAFLDGHHLIGDAAVKFSERFGRECVSPWVKRVP